MSSGTKLGRDDDLVSVASSGSVRSAKVPFAANRQAKKLVTDRLEAIAKAKALATADSVPKAKGAGKAKRGPKLEAKSSMPSSGAVAAAEVKAVAKGSVSAKPKAKPKTANAKIISDETTRSRIRARCGGKSRSWPYGPEPQSKVDARANAQKWLDDQV